MLLVIDVCVHSFVVVSVRTVSQLSSGQPKMPARATQEGKDLFWGHNCGSVNPSITLGNTWWNRVAHRVETQEDTGEHVVEENSSQGSHVGGH